MQTKKTSRSQPTRHRTRKAPALAVAPGFDPTIAKAIAAELARGRPIAAICGEPGMPSRWTMLEWLDERSEFRRQFDRAREAFADHLADEILTIADDSSGDWATKTARDGSAAAAVNHDHISRAKLRGDARKWLLARMLPRKYAERVQHGNDPDNPLTTPVDERELAKAIVAALARGVKDDGEGG